MAFESEWVSMVEHLTCLGGAAVRRRTRDRVPACMAGVRRGAFTCVGWQVTLCDPIW